MSSVQFSDHLLPNQTELMRYFRGVEYEASLYDTICWASGIESPHNELTLELSDRWSVEQMASNPVNLRFLQFLIRIAAVRRVLEVGTFVGVSTIYFARALPDDGEVVGIEKCEEFAALARRNFAANGVADRIRLLEGDAYEVMQSIPAEPPFDLVFIDGNKERYKDYFIIAERLLAPKGLVIVDDCFFHGDAINPTPLNEKGKGVREFLDYAARRDDYLRIALPLANGVMLMTRR